MASSDGEESSNFYEVWPNIARYLGIRLGSAKYKALAKMWDLLQAVYCTYQSLQNLPHSRWIFAVTAPLVLHHGIY